MTVATCVFCGAEKWGSFNECKSCGKRPAQELDIAYSLALSDHYFDHKTLRRIGKEIETTGQRPNLPPEQEKRFLETAKLYSKTIGPVIRSHEAGDIEGARRRAAEMITGDPDALDRMRNERRSLAPSPDPLKKSRREIRREREFDQQAQELLEDEIEASELLRDNGDNLWFGLGSVSKFDPKLMSLHKDGSKFIGWWQLSAVQQEEIQIQTQFDPDIVTAFLDSQLGIRLAHDENIGDYGFIDIWDKGEALKLAKAELLGKPPVKPSGRPKGAGRSDGIEPAFKTLNKALDDYIEVHNYLFALKIRRILPIPFFFESVNYRNSSKTLAGIYERLDDAVQRLKDTELLNASVPLDYFSLLRSTVNQLQKLTQRLSDKADGKQYPHREYTKDMELYDTLRKAYTAQGQQLNHWMLLHGHLTRSNNAGDIEGIRSNDAAMITGNPDALNRMRDQSPKKRSNKFFPIILYNFLAALVISFILRVMDPMTTGISWSHIAGSALGLFLISGFFAWLISGRRSSKVLFFTWFTALIIAGIFTAIGQQADVEKYRNHGQDKSTDGDAGQKYRKRERSSYFPSPLSDTIFMSTGLVRQRRKNSAIAPLEIKTAKGGNYYVKIVDVISNREEVVAYIVGGDTYKLKIPLGEFLLRYAAGKRWKGEAEYFGDGTVFSKAEKTFVFRRDGNEVTGYRVELILQRGGNLRTKQIRRSEF